MFNPINEAQTEVLQQLIRKHNLQIFETDILKMAQNCIQLQLVSSDEIPIGSSKMGGLPDAPLGWNWPYGLEFIGQFNLAELAPCDHNHILPSRGLLSFFHGGAGSTGYGMGCANQVEFFDEDPSKLRQAEAPEGYLSFRDSHYNSPTIFASMRVIPHSKISLPDAYFNSAQKILTNKGERYCNERGYSSLLDELRYSKGQLWSDEHHQLFGYDGYYYGHSSEDAWADTTKLPRTLLTQEIGEAELEMAGAEYYEALLEGKKLGAISGLENLDEATIRQLLNNFWGDEKGAYLWFLHGEGAQSSTKERARQQVNQWISLFETNSDNRIGTMFNDAGSAHFMIRQEDLANSNFQSIYSTIDSS